MANKAFQRTARTPRLKADVRQTLRLLEEDGGQVMNEWIVAGEASVWMGSGERAWKNQLSASVRLDTSKPPAFLDLDFRVASFLRNGQVFDLDNMVTPVFNALLGPRRSQIRLALLGWRATRVENQDTGLRLRQYDEALGTFELCGSVLVLDATLRGRLPVDSREGGSPFVAGIQEALGPWAPERTHRFAVALAFGDDVRDITWVEGVPIKPVVDCLFPVFGGRPGAPDDWKVDAIQVERGRPDLRGACAIKIWELAAPQRNPQAHVAPTAVVTLSSMRLSRTDSTRSGMTNFDYLDQAAKELGSPPTGLRIGEILDRAAQLFPAMANVSKDSASASMDFQTINVRGRASYPGDFDAPDRWNRSPAFIKVARGVWRRLSEEERAVFATLWRKREPLLRQESFDAADWDQVFRSSR
jgi:hypothetical protein